MIPPLFFRFTQILLFFSKHFEKQFAKANKIAYYVV